MSIVWWKYYVTTHPKDLHKTGIFSFLLKTDD